VTAAVDDVRPPGQRQGIALLAQPGTLTRRQPVGLEIVSPPGLPCDGEDGLPPGASAISRPLAGIPTMAGRLRFHQDDVTLAWAAAH